MSYRSRCCCDTLSVIYFPLSFALLHVLIHSFSFCLPFPLSSLSSLSSASRVWVVGSSPLCSLNIERRVACGWGQRTLFLSLCCLSLLFCCSLNQFLSSEGYLQSALQVLVLLATLEHPSFICSSFFLLLNSFIFLNVVCYHYMDHSFLSVFPSPVTSPMGLSLPWSQGQSRFLTEHPDQTNLIFLDWLLKYSVQIGNWRKSPVLSWGM